MVVKVIAIRDDDARALGLSHSHDPKGERPVVVMRAEIDENPVHGAIALGHLMDDLRKEVSLILYHLPEQSPTVVHGRMLQELLSAASYLNDKQINDLTGFARSLEYKVARVDIGTTISVGGVSFRLVSIDGICRFTDIVSFLTTVIDGPENLVDVQLDGASGEKVAVTYQRLAARKTKDKIKE